MTPENFCYWLQGFVEIADPKELTPDQLQEIKNHLKLVFNKVTPQLNPWNPDFSKDWEPIHPMESKFCSGPQHHASC